VTNTPPLRPMAAPGVVTVDVRERALIVRPAADADGLAKVLWAVGVRAQVKAASSYASDVPTVWASGGGQDKIAFGLPAGSDALKFQFHSGHPQYTKLVGTPGLRATIVVDRETSQILGVRFTGR
jgi:hypothetical protein